MIIQAGIDDLNLYASTLAVDFADIVAARRISPGLLEDIGFARRSVLPTFEDPVTLAVNATKPIVDAAEGESFGLLIIATETGLDYGKPLSSYVHRHLDLGPFCRNFEVKHACYGGTAAVQMAAAWVRSGVAPGKRALVVMTDIGRRHFHESAELSVGAGAIALSIAAEPRLFALETDTGYASREVYDTARPTSTGEWIDSTLSLGSYLDLLEVAWEAYRAAAAPAPFERHFTYMIYHTPLLSLVRQAHKILLEGDGDILGREEVADSFERMVMPSFGYNREIGNTYSASLYAALAAIVSGASSSDPQTRVGCFSYGSGACAEIFSGLVQGGASAALAQRRIGEHLTARRKVSIQEYEQAVTGVERSLSVEAFEPDWQAPAGHYEQAYRGKNLLVLQGVKNHYRSYTWS